MGLWSAYEYWEPNGSNCVPYNANGCWETAPYYEIHTIESAGCPTSTAAAIARWHLLRHGIEPSIPDIYQMLFQGGDESKWGFYEDGDVDPVKFARLVEQTYAVEICPQWGEDPFTTVCKYGPTSISVLPLHPNDLDNTSWKHTCVLIGEHEGGLLFDSSGGDIDNLSEYPYNGILDNSIFSQTNVSYAQTHVTQMTYYISMELHSPVTVRAFERYADGTRGAELPIWTSRWTPTPPMKDPIKKMIIRDCYGDTEIEFTGTAEAVAPNDHYWWKATVEKSDGTSTPPQKIGSKENPIPIKPGEVHKAIVTSEGGEIRPFFTGKVNPGAWDMTLIGYWIPTTETTTLPNGTRIAKIHIYYSPRITASTVQAELDGVDVTNLFVQAGIIAGGSRWVELTLPFGTNKSTDLVITGNGVSIDGRNAKYKGTLTFISNCASDNDSDGVCVEIDNCQTVCNPQQLDADNDGQGDVCDTTPGCGGCGQPQCEQQCS